MTTMYGMFILIEVGVVLSYVTVTWHNHVWHVNIGIV